MPKYCFDTSGLSVPFDSMPEDIHASLWASVKQFIADGHAAVTKEIFDEMILIDGGLGEFIRTSKAVILYEVGGATWDWRTYLQHTTQMQNDYKQFISELNGGAKGTIGLNDVSIICLAKTLGLPLMSMEKKSQMLSSNKRKIPDICTLEALAHVDFIEFQRSEGFRF